MVDVVRYANRPRGEAFLSATQRTATHIGVHNQAIPITSSLQPGPTVGLSPMPSADESTRG